MKFGTLFFVLLGLNCRSTICKNSSLDSTVEALPGHYPYMYCLITNVVFDSSDDTFVYQSDEKDHEKCRATGDVWPLSNNPDLSKYKCDEVFDIGYSFLFFYWARSSNYYHITYDTMIPLFKELFYKKQPLPSKVAFMPAVESQRLQKLTWSHDAFDQEGAYWADMIKLFTKTGKFMPLNEAFRTGKTYCFKKLYFGTTNVDFTDTKLIHSFIDFVKNELGTSSDDPVDERMILVSRKGRRRLLNEVEVADSVQDIITTDLVDFAPMSFKEQVEAMQKYTIFTALNGAGLINSLYLPPYAVAIQMVPYKSGLNVRQYDELIKQRGPTMEWHNTFENLTREYEGDPFRNRPDTIVHIDDFRKTLKEAVALAREAKAKLWGKAEL